MFEEQSRQMVRDLIRKFTEKGYFSSKKEALEYLQDSNWLKEKGYGHVSHVLSSPTAIAECESFFDELDTRLMRRLTSGIHEFKSTAFRSQQALFE